MPAKPQTEIWLTFGDGEYLFKFGLEQIAEIERKCGKPVAVVYRDLLSGSYVDRAGQLKINPAEAAYSLMDVREPIRQGLIGGGMGRADGKEITVTPATAMRLMDAYCYPVVPLQSDWSVALTAVSACTQGYTPPAEKKTESRKAKPQATGSSITAAPSPTA